MSFNAKKNMLSTIVVTTVLDLIPRGTGRGAGAYIIETPLGIFDVINQAVPDVVQQQDGTVDTSHETIELFKASTLTP